MEISTKFSVGDVVRFMDVTMIILEAIVNKRGVSYGCRRSDGAFIVFHESEIRAHDIMGGEADSENM